MRFASLLFLLPLLLTGCAISQLEAINPQADNFDSALAAEYLGYSQSEYEQGHFVAGEHFAHKGIRAAHGEEVPPEPVNSTLGEADQKDLGAEREQLVSLINDNTKKDAPQKAARAQLLFDCLQQQDKRDASEIQRQKAPCEDEFASALSQLQEIDDSFIHGSEKDYAIRFAASSAALSKSAQQTIAGIAKTATKAKHYAIQLESHADAEENALAENRLNAVSEALRAHGVSFIHIHEREAESSHAVRLSNDEPPVHPNEVEITLITGEKTHAP